MKRRVVGFLVAVVVVAALLVSGNAPVMRAQEAMPWMRVDILEVIPQELNEFIEVQLEHVNPALQRAGVPWRSAWRTAEFGNQYERMFVTPMDDLSNLDRGGPLAFLDRRDRERLDERVRRTISGHRTYALRYRPELSVESQNAGGLALAWITTLEVAPGRLADWQAFMRERLPQFRGDSVVFGMYERYLGSGAAVWQLVENHSSFTELDRPTIMQRALGARTSDTAAGLAGVVLSVERTVLRYDPELSFSGAGTASEGGRFR
jgi:hypothetical protein